MKTLLLDGCDPVHEYRQLDPDEPAEKDFESWVGRALACAYPHYQCVVFRGAFRYDDRIQCPDLALVARDFSHWFVIEVELVSHSLEKHVLPQVVTFKNGTPEADCVKQLATGLGMDEGRANRLLTQIPKDVAVVVNRWDQMWQLALAAHRIQMLTVSAFRSASGKDAMEIDGYLQVVRQSLGFGQYSTADRSLRFPKETARWLSAGEIQVRDVDGIPSLWNVALDERFLWLTKVQGTPSIAEGTFIQLIRGADGALKLREA